MIVYVLLFERHRFLITTLSFFLLFLQLLSLFFPDCKYIQDAFDDRFPEQVAKDYNEDDNGDKEVIRVVKSPSEE